MAYIPAAERAKIPAEDFAGPHRSFPIRNQADVADAARLIGHAKNPEAVKRRIIAIAKRKGLSIPDAWKTDAKKMTLDFALPAERTVHDEYAVYPASVLFRAGDYPDKGASFGPEELYIAALNFAPVAGNIQHTDYLKGRAGEIRRMWQSDDGDSLHGEVWIPRWLDEGLTDAERRLSVEWDLDTMTIGGFALCTNPRVSDARLMTMEAEFAKHQTPSGQSKIQYLHDMTAQSGAVCKAGNAANMASTSEASAIQQAHDLLTAAGAKCESMTNRAASSLPYSSHSHNQRSAQADRTERRMSFKDTLRAWVGLGMPDDYDPATQPPANGGTVNFADFTRLKTQFDDLQAKFDAQQPLVEAGRAAEKARREEAKKLHKAVFGSDSTTYDTRRSPSWRRR